MFLAAYKGEQFIDIADTYAEMAQKLGIKASSAKFLASPVSHRRNKGDKLLIYRYEED